MKAVKLLAFFCFVFSVGAFAQTEKTIEADLVRHYKKIEYWGIHYQNKNSSDSLEKANVDLINKLKIYAVKYPNTINYPFNTLSKDLDITTSGDGNFRIYSWDTLTGGTMHFFENVFQYKVGVKTFSSLDTNKVEGEPKPNFHKLHTFNANNKAYYLAIYLNIGSTKDAGSGIHVFTIENGTLKDAKIIKTNSGLHDELSYWYDFGSIVDIAFDKRPDIHFDNASKAIYLPLVNSKGAVTNKYITYKFTGQYFEKVK